MAKTLKCWLAREKTPREDMYALSVDAPLRDREVSGAIWFYADDLTFVCPRQWHAVGGLRLKPGEGPVRVEISVTCRRVK